MYTISIFVASVLFGIIAAQDDQVPGDDLPYVEEPTSAQAIALPIVGILALLLLIAPFIVQWRGKNIGQCSQIFYLSLANLFTVTNAIIWPNFNYMTWWPGYIFCDIQAKLNWPYVTGIACATVCITRRLAIAIDPESMKVSSTKREKLRNTLEDLAICFLVPILQIALHYVVQYNRYYVTAIGGCTASFDNSWPTIVIMYIWPPIFCLINCYYSVLIIYRLRLYRHKVAKLLGNNHKNLTMFLRLLGNSLLLVLIYTPVSIYFFYVNVNIPWYSYDFDLIHDPATWWTIIYLPDLGVRTFDRWCNIAMSFFVFLFFGTGTHAMETYRSWLLAIGLGRLFPGLKEPRHPTGRRGSKESKSWGSQWSLISRARRYFENRSRSSHGASAGTGHDSQDDYGMSSRKSSLLPTHIQHKASISSPSTFTTAGSTSNNTRTNSITPLNPILSPSYETSYETTHGPRTNTSGRIRDHSNHGFPAMTYSSAWLAKKIWGRKQPTTTNSSSTPTPAVGDTAQPAMNARTATPPMFSGVMPGGSNGALGGGSAHSVDLEAGLGDSSVETKVWSTDEKERGGSLVPGEGTVKVKKIVERSEERSM